MFGFNIDKIVKQLNKLLDETGLTEIEYQVRGKKIKVSRNISSQQSQFLRTETRTEKSQLPKDHKNAITSPMVGTICLSNDPKSEPFVKPGYKIQKGQALLIIEAMKTMNPINAPRAGTVTKILVKNEQPVEFGEELLLIE